MRAIILCILIIFSFKNSFCETREYLPKTLPTTALYDLDGKEVFLDKLDGNVLLVHFWATWCATCADEMENLNKLQKLLRKDPVIIIPISEDFKGSDTIKAFYNKFNLKFLPAFVDKSNKWFKEMKVSSLPATFIIDSQGRNVLSMGSKVDWLDEKNINLIKSYIADKQPYNQDYVSLLKDHPVTEDKPKAKEKEKKSKVNKEEFLRSVETDLSPNLDEGNLKQGEIGMTNNDENDFKKRRRVNLDIDGGE